MTNSYRVLLILALLLIGLNGVVLAQFNDGREVTFNSEWAELPGGGGGGGNDDEGDDSGLGFGKKIAGAWLGTGEFAFDPDCDGVGDAPPTVFDYDSQSFTASGLYISTNPSNPNLGHGTWKKTGPREVSTNNIVYLTDAEGVVQFILRIPGVFTFDSHFETATSTFGAIGYLPGENPLDPAVIPQWCTAGQHYLLQKVSVTP